MLAHQCDPSYYRQPTCRADTSLGIGNTELRDQLQTTLGSAYTLERELGGGGMSRVFIATDTALGRQVVVKVLAPELAPDVNSERFRREIQLAAQLQQANIVPVLTAGQLNGLPFYTMPLVDGLSLRHRLATGPPFTISEAVSVLRDVAKALAYAHGRGVVHRDIKPDNVLLSGGTAVVTDFGVAKALSAARGVGTRIEALTAVGMSLGTPAYMAPEQAAADPDADHRVDVYAFGVMAYELLAGQPPFHGRTPQRLLAAQMSEAPEPITAKRPDTPPLLAEIVMRCLAKDADARPQSAADLVHALDTVTSGGSLQAMPEVLLGGRRRLGRALVLWALATTGVALVARAAMIVMGLPDWVFPGAVITMLLGLPVILFTALVHHGAHRAVTQGAFTPGGTEPHQPTWTRLAVKASPWVSWRRTARGGVTAIGVFTTAVLAFMVLRALGIGPAGSLLAAGKLAAREPLLVSEFDVRGPDSTLGAALGEAVRTDLGQSRVVAVVPSGQVADALNRMQRPATTRVDLAVAREIAQREGIKGIVVGNLAPVGTGYLVTLRLIEAASGAELASYHRTAESSKDLISVIDELTRTLRGRIGESLREVRENPPLIQMTTSSLPALQRYTEGSYANDVGDFDRAIGLLHEAVTLDSTFAMAYRKLGIALGNENRPPDQVIPAMQQAYRFRDHLTERERLLAMASYFAFVNPDRAKELATYDALLARDSLDDIAMVNRGDLLTSRREFARADSMYRRSLAAKIGSLLELRSLTNSQLRQGSPRRASGVLDTAFLVLGRTADIEPWATAISYAEGKLDSTVSQLARVKRAGRSSWEVSWAGYRLGDIALMRGRLAESARYYAEAVEADRSRGAPAPPHTEALAAAGRAIFVRNDRSAGVQMLDQALASTPMAGIHPRTRPYGQVAAMYAAGGRPERAGAVLAEYVRDMRDSAEMRLSAPEVHNARAELALADGRFDAALAEFRAGDMLPDGPVDGCTARLAASLGRVFDAAGLADSAIAQYEHYLAAPRLLLFDIDRPAHYTIPDAIWLPRARRRLAALYEQKGERAKAIAQYEAFIDLWSTADAELQPQVAAARQHLARLRGGT